MELGLGVLGWPPEVFWRATLPELMRALDGWRLARGLRRTGAPEPLSRPAFEALKARLEH